MEGIKPIQPSHPSQFPKKFSSFPKPKEKDIPDMEKEEENAVDTKNTPKPKDVPPKEVLNAWQAQQNLLGELVRRKAEERSQKQKESEV